MKNKALTALLVCAAALTAWPLFAQATFPKPPTATEVVLVARIVVSPPPNDEFLGKLMSVKDPKAHHRVMFSYWPKEALLKIPAVYPFGDLGEVGMFKFGIPASRSIVVPGFRVLLFGVSEWYITLPVNMQFDIPAGANYVYLGTLTYHRSDDYFTLDGLAKDDEYDAVQDIVKKQFGQDARLYRVNLRELDPAK